MGLKNPFLTKKIRWGWRKKSLACSHMAHYCAL